MGISKIIEMIDQYQIDSDSQRFELYFRGQKSKDKLIPKFLRTKHEDHHENNLYCDSWVIGNNEFLNSRNSWEILAKMQHFGIPTRLLDWTSSLIFGLYFALSDCIDCKNKLSCTNKKKKRGCRGNPTLWILNSNLMHSELHTDINNVAFTVGIDDIPDYYSIFVKNEENEWSNNRNPIFLEIPWTNNRISSQKGYFTFHFDKCTERPKSLEELLEDSKALIKIEINPVLKSELLKEFKVMGVNEFDIYPDLSSIGRHTLRSFNQ